MSTQHHCDTTMTNFIPTYSSRRILPKFTIPGGMDAATFNKLYQAGLGDFFEKNLAYEVWQDSCYSFTLYPKTIPSLPYEALITLLPKYDCSQIVRTVDELPPDTLSKLLNGAATTLATLRETALDDGHAPRYGFVFQHIGPNDAYPKAPFNTSYLPLHFHLQLHECPLESFALFTKGESIDTTTPEYENFFHDTATLIAQDMLRNHGITARRRGFTALEVGEQHPLTKPFTPNEAAQLIAFQQAWKHHWQAIASCFTDFSEDSYGRHSLYPVSERQTRLEVLIANDYPYISKESRQALAALAHKLKDEVADSSLWAYKGVNGTAGYIIDYEEKKRTFVFSPKLFTNTYRHYDVVQQEFIITKDKLSDTLAPKHEAEQILDIQRRLVRKLQNRPG